MSNYHPADTAGDWYGTGSNEESTGIGPCADCGHRDCNRYYTPFYGYWTGDTIDSDVLLLCEAPGGNADDGRQVKNAADMDAEFNPDSDSVTQDWFTRESDRDLIEVAESSDNGFNFPASFVSNLLSKGHDAYFTNVKKCNDIKSDYGESSYESARDSCAPHLDDELSAVDPSVVVVFSASTQGDASGNLTYCFNRFGLGSEVDGKQVTDMVVPDTEDPNSMFPTFESPEGFTVIPSYHFTRTGRSLQENMEFDPSKLGYADKSYSTTWKYQYYDELVEKIADAV